MVEVDDLRGRLLCCGRVRSYAGALRQSGSLRRFGAKRIEIWDYVSFIGRVSGGRVRVCILSTTNEGLDIYSTSTSNLLDKLRVGRAFKDS